MSRIKDLKNSESNNINLIKLIEQMLVSNKTKYVELFRKVCLERINTTDTIEGVFEDIRHRLPGLTFDEDLNVFELMFLSTLISWADQENVMMFNQFVDYNEKTLVERNDLTTYKTFDELTNEINKVDLKLISKEMESQVITVYSDDEWLIIKPLTYDSSKKYGSNTKWCTTSAKSPDYFFRYTTNGILIYCINKKTGYKVAAHKEMTEKDITFWNQKDERIDSSVTELPDDVLSILRKDLKTCTKSNALLIDTKLRQRDMETHLKAQMKVDAIGIALGNPRRIAVDNRFDDQVGDDRMEQPMEEDRPMMDGEEMGMGGTNLSFEEIYASLTLPNDMVAHIPREDYRNYLSDGSNYDTNVDYGEIERA